MSMFLEQARNASAGVFLLFGIELILDAVGIEEDGIAEFGLKFDFLILAVFEETDGNTFRFGFENFAVAIDHGRLGAGVAQREEARARLPDRDQEGGVLGIHL